MGTLRFETYGMPGETRRETLREYVHRHLHTTGSVFKRVQRRCNHGLTNAEWNALSFEQREKLNKCGQT